MIKVPQLNQGDTVGVIAPSAPLAYIFERRFKQGIAGLEKSGFKVEIAKNALAIDGHTAGTIAERVSDLHEMFKRDDIRAIFCAIGGFNANQLLPFIDYDIVRAHPKIIIGYSDITVLSLAIYAKTDIITFSGPMVMTQFGEVPGILDYSLQSLQKVLMNTHVPIVFTPSPNWTDEFLDWGKNLDTRPRAIKTGSWNTIKSGTATGKLIGGHLGTLGVLVGTEYLPSFENSLLFLEDTESSIDEVDRYLWHLRHAGILDQINALLVGRMHKISGADDVSLRKTILLATEGYGFPIVINMDFGHTDPILTLPIGVEASIDSEKLELQILESAVF